MYVVFLLRLLALWAELLDVSYMTRFLVNIVALLPALLAVVSCKHSYSIDGSVDLYGYEGENLYLVTHENDVFSVVDSCCVRHGHFNMSGKVDSTVFAVLCHGFEPILPLFIEKGKVIVHIAPSILDVKGTRLNNTLYEFLDKKNDIDNRYEDLLQRSQYLTNIMNPSVSYDDSLKVVVDEAEEHIFGFMRKHYTDPLGVCVFMMMCNGSSTDAPSPLIRRILDAAPEKFLNNRTIRTYTANVGYR